MLRRKSEIHTSDGTYFMTEENEHVKTEDEIFNEERVRTLQEALTIDYLEKFDIYAKLKITQRDLVALEIAHAKVQKINALIGANNRTLTEECSELRGRHKYEHERTLEFESKNKELRKRMRDMKDKFSPTAEIEEPYIEPEPVKKKPKKKIVDVKTDDKIL